MPMPLALRDALKNMFDAAESAPDKQAVIRITVIGAVYKILVNLSEFPNEVRVVIRKRS